MSTNPTIKTSQPFFFSTSFTLLLTNRKYPIAKLRNDQNKFTIGGESPLPGGFENGVGNSLPEIPLIKCGTVFAMNTPAKNRNR